MAKINVYDKISCTSFNSQAWRYEKWIRRTKLLGPKLNACNWNVNYGSILFYKTRQFLSETFFYNIIFYIKKYGN